MKLAKKGRRKDKKERDGQMMEKRRKVGGKGSRAGEKEGDQKMQELGILCRQGRKIKERIEGRTKEEEEGDQSEEEEE